MRVVVGYYRLAADGAAWRHGMLYALSLVGPEPAVRGAVRELKRGALALIWGARGAHEAYFLNGEGLRVYTAHVPGGLHAVVARPGIYLARERDPRREALWLSRQMGLPVPPEWVDELLEEAEAWLEAEGLVAFYPVPASFYRGLLARKRGEG